MERSKQLDVASYGTDKLEAGYLPHYDRELAHLVDRPITMLEIGVLRGSSLRLWSDYFPQGTIVGLDLNPLDEGYELPPRTSFAQGDQTDTALLDRVAAEHAPEGFDLILDDASHLGLESRTTFEHLFEHHLRSGGTYLLEDWQTGYWPTWIDGTAIGGRAPKLLDRVRTVAPRVKGGGRLSRRLAFPSHDGGMVGVLKQIVDVLGAPEQAHLQLPSATIDRIVVTPGLAFITKG